MKLKRISALAIITLTGLIGLLLISKSREKALAREVVKEEELLLLLQTPRKVGIGQIVRCKVLLLQQNGRPIQAQPVIFSSNGGNFVSGTIAYTNNWGEVYFDWQAPSTSGTFTLWVHYFGPEGQVASGETSIEVLGVPPSHQILVDYAPERMAIDSGEDEFVSLFIHLFDQQGNPIVGETINLQTNLGQFGVAKVKPVIVDVERWIEIEREETSVFVPRTTTITQDTLVVTYSQEVNLVTDDYGTTWVALYPPDQPGVATVRVSTSQQEITLFCIFTTLEGLHLTSDSFCTVGNEGAQIIARLYDAAGKPISGQVVTFQTTLGQLCSSQEITDENGEAVVTLFGSGVEGTAVVTASALGYTDKIYVDIFSQFGSDKMFVPPFRLVSLQPPRPQPSYYIVTIFLNRSEVRPLGTGTPNTVSIRALVRDHRGRPASVPLGTWANREHIHNSRRPAGTFSPPQGYSDARGQWQTVYTVSEFGGYEEVRIFVRYSIPQRDGYGRIRVRVPNLGYMPTGTNYRLVGQTRSHPRNHYATQTVRNALVNIARVFHSRFSGQPGYQLLDYNDISLVWGGLFDIYANW